MQILTVRPAIEAQELIEAYIRENSLAPDDQLPPERDLAERWGVSRSSIRTAIRTLTAENKVYNRHGAGTYVSPPRVIRNLRDLRPFADVVAQAGRSMTTTMLSCRVTAAGMELADRLAIDLGSPIYALRRLRKIDGQPAAVETSYLDAVRFPGLAEAYRDDDSLYGVLDDRYGVRVDHGYEKLTVATADAEIAALLDVSEGQALFALTGVSRDHRENPVESFHSIVRSDRVGFASELRVRVESTSKGAS